MSGFKPPSTSTTPVQFQAPTTVAPSTTPAQPTATPVANTMPAGFAALFNSLGDAKGKKTYAPRLTPGSVVRDLNLPADGNANWISWAAETWYVVEIQQAELVYPDKPGAHPFVRVKMTVHDNGGGETPVGEAEHAFWASDKKRFGEEMADFVSALYNIHLRDPDPSNPRAPLTVRLGAEAISPANPLAGKFVAVKVGARREGGKSKHVQGGGKPRVFCDYSFFPVVATKNEDGSYSFAPPAVDARQAA